MVTLPLTMGFLGMGVLDGLHAASRPEEGFVFLHSVASLAVVSGSSYSGYRALLPTGMHSGRLQMGLKPKLVLTFLLIALIAVVAIGGYYYPNQEKPERFSGERESVRIGLSAEVATSLIIIAKEKGFFSQEGLDVEFKGYPSGKRSIEGMFAGEVDISTPTESPVVFNSFKRQDFSIVATIASTDKYHRIIARKDRGILEPGDLKGKRIATQKASAVHYFLHLFLMNYGLSEKDIALSFKNPEELPEALAMGEIDAFSMREPFISQAKRLLRDNAVVFQAPGLYLRTDHIVSSNSFIKDKPEVIKKNTPGIDKGRSLCKE